MVISPTALTIWGATFVLAMRRPCAVCHACPFAPRRQFDEGAVLQLSESDAISGISPAAPVGSRGFFVIAARRRAKLALVVEGSSFDNKPVEPPHLTWPTGGA
jgi:hypothetical protein